MTTITSTPPIDGARARFAENGLDFPPLPAELEPLLDEIEEGVYATAPLLDTLHNVDGFAAEVDAFAEEARYAAIGFDGRGINGWGVHYYLVMPGLALFMQFPWGNAYGNPEGDRALAKRGFAWAAEIQEKIGSAVSSGLLRPENRLVVVASSFAGGRFAMLPAASALTSPKNLKATVDDMLAEIAAGKYRG